jgi:hypothetical protein
LGFSLFTHELKNFTCPESQRGLPVLTPARLLHLTHAEEYSQLFWYHWAMKLEREIWKLVLKCGKLERLMALKEHCDGFFKPIDINLLWFW